jgi:hypothetical protein
METTATLSLLNPSAKMPARKTFTELARPSSNYRLRPKANIPVDKINKVKANLPFKEYFDDNTAYFNFENKEVYSRACESFLKYKYPKMQEVGISFKIEDCQGVQFTEDLKKVNSYEETYKAFAKLKDAYSNEWSSLNAERRQLLAMKNFSDIPSEKFTPLNYFLNEIAYVYLRKDEVELKNYLGLYQMYRNQPFDAPVVLPLKYLPEILLACPVWYENNSVARDKILSHPFVKTPLKDLYYFYNPQRSQFSDYDGEDDISKHILDNLSNYQMEFSTLVIATPYHAKAKPLAQYVPPPSPPNVDPYLIGFKKELPNHFFVIDRWCKGGILPLMEDMIADTICNIEERVKSLKNNQDKLKSSYIQQGHYSNQIDSWLRNIKINWHANGQIAEVDIITFLETIIAKFNHNALFSYLK